MNNNNILIFGLLYEKSVQVILKQKYVLAIHKFIVFHTIYVHLKIVISQNISSIKLQTMTHI